MNRVLTPHEIDAFGRELDALRQEVLDQRGQRDVDHIRSVVRTMRYAEAAGRLLLHVGIDPATFALGSGALGLAKILENMEIGHNVMHGQYDWTHDPELDGETYDWDMACAAHQWREYHNFEHHTFTNILGRDRDVGYGFLRVTSEQPWNPAHIIQPFVAVGLAFLFQWGIGAHALRLDETIAGRQSVAVLWTRARPFLAKGSRQLFKDYVFFPALALANAPRVALGNFIANGTRNVWAFAIIFCGHFPEGVRMYHEQEIQDEPRGAWYLRQIHGSANIKGGRLFHVLSGHLSHQIEHHLFPDLPACRYPEIAPRVRAICERYGQSYNTGSFRAQLTSVARQILENALPSRARPARMQ
ncbi:acyl-CoA desaturase [Polyangium sp. 15x6]|uniref:fatty acid desaturase family protein n=1 Tax=Polyangium sp. 15x6 TaxID=3042687 RepID=UPI00249BA471|nr:acyl-CoA desaturase [Polyangium sp. 15x6]MDI3289680.1 acyl-CoA desaturase [Polyangium sp. 15x6]